MPIYAYRCKCGNDKELLHNISGAPLVVCEKCGEIMDKQFSAPNIYFKNGGSWKNDWKQTNKN